MLLGLEPLLRSRLAEVPELLAVHGLPDLEDVAKAGKRTPCVFVAYQGYDVLESTAHGKAARVRTSWAVILAVKNAHQAADGAPVRASANPLLSQILNLLLGWKPSAEFSWLELASGPAPVVQPGLILLPLVFTTMQVVKGNADPLTL